MGTCLNMLKMCETGSAVTINNTVFHLRVCTFRYVHLSPKWLQKCRKPTPKMKPKSHNCVFTLSWTLPETTMKIKVEKVRTWVPQGSRNGSPNHLKNVEKTHLATASENASKNHLKIDEKSIWGYPP